jgi:hypothetical protein
MSAPKTRRRQRHGGAKDTAALKTRQCQRHGRAKDTAPRQQLLSGAFCFNIFWIFKKLTSPEFHGKWWQIFCSHLSTIAVVNFVPSTINLADLSTTAVVQFWSKA